MQPFSFDGQEINNGNLRVDSQSNSGDYTLTRTLDSFKFEKVDFIKIDIQGSEFKALCGAKNLLLHFRPILFLEIEEQQLKSLGTSTKELIEKLFSLDYVLFRINTSYPCDHICVPIENANKFEKKYKDRFCL